MSPAALKVAFLTRYDSQGASSRVRALQYLPLLQAAGIAPTVFPLLSQQYVAQLYQGRRDWKQVAAGYGCRLRDCMQLASFDLVWLEKEVMPMLPYPAEALLLRGKRLVLDLDDAIFHNYDRSGSAAVRHLLGDKIDRLMARATLVTAGNSYLAARARKAGARWVEQLPSTVPLARYPRPERPVSDRKAGEPRRIVWIGSPATAHYLELVRAPLQRVAQGSLIELCVIGAQAPAWEGVNSRSIKWSEATEAQELAACDIGIMPLADTPWEQGKCSFKLIQYMACGLPVVAAPVGMNLDVVRDGENGRLASSDAEWVAALLDLLTDPQRAAALGRQGRSDVEDRFSTEVQGARLAALLHQAAGQG